MTTEGLPVLCTQVLAIVTGGRSGMRCETMEIVWQAIVLIACQNPAAEMKKGLVLARPSIKIAGAQEGTRTPTELPAST